MPHALPCPPPLLAPQACRTEAEYAFQQRKKIVPLIMESGYRPTGWLGALIGTRLYFDLSDAKSIPSKAPGLFKELGDAGRWVPFTSWALVLSCAAQSRETRGWPAQQPAGSVGHPWLFAAGHANLLCCAVLCCGALAPGRLSYSLSWAPQAPCRRPVDCQIMIILCCVPLLDCRMLPSGSARPAFEAPVKIATKTPESWTMAEVGWGQGFRASQILKFRAGLGFREKSGSQV